tara:strand:- start:393 stop:911 length:519 start_codon:yes stop_codon:yes gene_type:complete
MVKLSECPKCGKKAYDGKRCVACQTVWLKDKGRRYISDDEFEGAELGNQIAIHHGKREKNATPWPGERGTIPVLGSTGKEYLITWHLGVRTYRPTVESCTCLANVHRHHCKHSDEATRMFALGVMPDIIDMRKGRYKKDDMLKENALKRLSVVHTVGAGTHGQNHRTETQRA